MLPENNTSTDSQIVTPMPMHEPQIVSAKSSSKTMVTVLTILLVLALGVAGYFYQQIPKDVDDNNEPTPSVTETVTPTEQAQLPITTLPVTSSVTATPTPVDQKAVITGGLSYPSDHVPAMNVCAVNTITKAENCIKTKVNQFTFTLSVTAGTYLVYSEVDLASDELGAKAYYTKCDTYKDSFIPECNPNAGPEEDNGKWNDSSFVCYNDATCKNAFTPLPITVKAKETKKLTTIIQGWYIPCSHDEATCNNPTFDVWQDYL